MEIRLFIRIFSSGSCNLADQVKWLGAQILKFNLTQST
jgi:hypothetical protein